jgi:hypothetical protein
MQQGQAPPDLEDVARAYATGISSELSEVLRATEGAIIGGVSIESVSTRGEGAGQNWILVKAALEELRLLFCSRSSKYKDVKRGMGESARQVVTAIAGYLAGVFSLGTAVAGGIVAGLLVVVYRIGVRAFCTYMSQGRRITT